MSRSKATNSDDLLIRRAQRGEPGALDDLIRFRRLFPASLRANDVRTVRCFSVETVNVRFYAAKLLIGDCAGVAER